MLLPKGCIRRERTSEAAPEAVRQAVGGGCRSGWGRLLSVTYAIEPGTWSQGDSGWGGGYPPIPMHPCAAPIAPHVGIHKTTIVHPPLLVHTHLRTARGPEAGAPPPEVPANQQPSADARGRNMCALRNTASASRRSRALQPQALAASLLRILRAGTWVGGWSRAAQRVSNAMPSACLARQLRSVVGGIGASMGTRRPPAPLHVVPFWAMSASALP